MSISKKFIFTFLVTFLIVIGVNLISLQYFSTRYFTQYIGNIDDTQITQQDFTLLDSLLFDPGELSETLGEYELIIRDLDTVVALFEDFVENDIRTPDEQFFIDKGFSDKGASAALQDRPIISFFSSVVDLSILRADTPASLFVLRVLQAMALVNILLVLMILVFLRVFIRSVFSPIEKITHNISDILIRGAYDQIDYQKTDEFSKLIDAINELNEKLSIQQKIRSQFLADMSHELKTPVTSIKCYLEGIQDGVLQLDDKNISGLIRELNRLIDITTSMMDHQKFENISMSFDIEDIDLKEIVDFLAQQYDVRMQKNNQHIQFVSRRKKLFFDRDKTVQILHNVISNFIKYAGPDTTLSIALDKNSTGYTLLCSDNGQGVPVDEVPFLKEKFYQSDISKSADVKHRGIGVGLSIIEKILDSYGGEYTIHSDIGEGFVISIYIPTK